MKPSYDVFLYQQLKEKYNFARSMMYAVSTNQHDARKLSKVLKKDDSGYREVRHIMNRNRIRLRQMNKDISRFNRFCEQYSELRWQS